MSRRLSIPLLGCLVALVLAPASRAYPGSNGDVLYTARHDGTNGLYLRHGDQAQLVRLDASLLPGAVFSPHGRRIALPRSLDGHAIWVIEANGNDLRRVTPAGVFAADPSWSPDGGALAFTGGRPAKRHVFVIGADGAGMHPLTRGKRAQLDPSWSETGRIAYVQRDRRGPHLYSQAATGGKARKLTAGKAADSAPAWSPDGRQLVYVRAGRALWLVGAHGGGAHRVIGRHGLPVTAPAWSPDGRWIVFAAGPPGDERVWMVHPDGHGLKPLTASGSDGRAPDWQAVGFAPVIMAAGDIACAPASANYNGGKGYDTLCGMARTADLMLRTDVDAVLALGDEQYNHGEYENFTRSFAPTWGRLGTLLHPVPGNHEYDRDPTAAWYFDYFDGVGAEDGAAGDRAIGGYYSFDVGTWHIVALNSNCNRVPGGCGTGSPQETWLRADLAARAGDCTLAYWHHPRFGSAGSNQAVAPLWQALYDNGADVVLSGHHHLYERMSPQDPAGVFDPRRGIREFIVGTGGKSLVGTNRRSPNDAVLDDSALGVLELDLGRGGYHWRFHSAGSSPFADSGEGICH
jgi:hypothetical protein